MLQAQVLLNRGDFAGAEAAFLEGSERAETRREATLGVAAALAGQNKHEDAAKTLQAFLDKYMPVDVGVRMQLSEIRMLQGKPELALAELNRVRVLRPRQGGLDEKTAMAHFALGQKAEAEAKFEQVRQDGQLSKSNYLVLARLYTSRDQLPQAEAVLKDFEKKYTPTSDSYLVRGGIQEAQKKFMEAEDAYRRAIQASDHDLKCWLAYGTFLNGQKRFKESLKVLSSALALDPRSIETLRLVAEAHEAEGDAPAVAAILQRILAIAPDDDKAMFGLVRVEEKRGAMDQVGAHLKVWSEKYPEKSWVNLSYARILAAIGQTTKAREILISSLGKAPGQSDVQAYLEQLRGNTAEAPKAPEPAMETAIVVEEAMRPEQLEQLTVKPVPAPSRAPASIVSVERTHVVLEGEVLGSISRMEYGTSKHWEKILDANRDQLKTPADLVPGMKLRIPPKDAHLVPDVKPEAKAGGISSFLGSLMQKTGALLDAAASAVIPQARAEEGSLLVSPDSMNKPKAPKPTAAAPAPVVMPAGSAVPIPELQPVAQPEADLPAASVPTQRADSKGGIHFAVGGGPNAEQSKVGGSGVTTSLPRKMGYVVGGELGYRLADLPGSVSLRGSYSSTKFDGFTGTSPAIVTVQRKRLALLGKFSPFESAGLNFTVGYMLARREAPETTPRAVITNSSSAGPVLGLGYASEGGAGIGWEAGVEFFFPHMREETGPNVTGSFKSACSSELTLGLTHQVAAGLTGALSLQIRHESASFAGTGSRGTINATEKEWVFALPLQVRF